MIVISSYTLAGRIATADARDVAMLINHLSSRQTGFYSCHDAIDRRNHLVNIASLLTPKAREDIIEFARQVSLVGNKEVSYTKEQAKAAILGILDNVDNGERGNGTLRG